MALQLSHKGLAEAHDLIAALALGVKVGSALAAAHRQAGEGVFEDLFKAQELDDGHIHAGMEAQAALGGADGGAELHPVAAVDLYSALIIHPGDAEEEAPLRLHHTVNDAGFYDVRPLLYHRLEGLQHFTHGLKKLGLMGVFFADIFIDALEIGILNLKCHCAKPLCLAVLRAARLNFDCQRQRRCCTLM